MSRNPRHSRLHRRALTIGIVFSVATHAAVLGLVRVEIRTFDRPDRVVAFEPAPAPPESEPDAPELLNLLESAPAAADPSATPADAASAGAASAAPSTAATAGAPATLASALPGAPAVPTVAADELTYDQLVVLDPLRNTAVEPVAFEDLPLAETTVAATVDDDDVPVWQPGAVGKAKRAWASAGKGESGDGEGRGVSIFIGPGGDGHCPMPTGRGRGGRVPPPVWDGARF